MATRLSRELDLIKRTVLWRGTLERNIRQQNKSASRKIALCIVEGLVFLKLAQQRGLEPAARSAQDRAGKGVSALRRAFALAQKKYRSTVFELPGFAVSPRFDNVLRKIVRHIGRLRQPGISPAILGRIYETDADGSRKGVYVTPDFISEYLVRQTLAPLLLHRKCPVVLDPACGAGAFPLKIFDQLVSIAGPVKTFNQRRSLLLKCVHGVDIDAFGVELAKLSLLLKLHEGAAPLRHAAVTDLSKNFRCANALVDFNPGGFDAVIVNPPYISIRELTRKSGTGMKRYLARKYACARGAYHLYVLFLEKSLRLIRARGRLGIIFPSTWTTARAASVCRKLVLARTRVESIADISQMCVFSKAGIYPHILISEKTRAAAGHCIRVVEPFSSSDLKRRTATVLLQQDSLRHARSFQLHTQ